MNRLLKTIYKHKIWFVYLPLIIHWAAIFVLTSIPGDSVPEFALDDKLKHFTAYFVLTIFLTFALKFQNRREIIRIKYLLVSFIITVIYSTIDEIHQVFIPGRSAEIWDWLANLMGILLGLALIRWIINRYESELELEYGTELPK